MPDISLHLPEFPYQFDLLLAVVRRFAFPARQKVVNHQLWRITDGQLVYYSVKDQVLNVSGEFSSDDDLIAASTPILGLEHNLSPFYVYAQTQPLLWSVIQPIVGLPIFCTETVFEALICLIIEQHITWTNALKAQYTLMKICDRGRTAHHVTVFDFPSPEQIAGLKPDQLKPLKITNRRIELILQIANDVRRGDLDVESIRGYDAESAYQFLLGIKGVGHWTANNVLGRSMGWFPYISHNDVALQSAVCHYFYQDQVKKSPQLVIDTFEPFGMYAGLAGHFTLLRWVLDRYPIID